MISGNLRTNNQEYDYQDYINHDRSGVVMGEKSKEIREDLNDLLADEFGVSEEELKEKRWESTHKPNQGAPYSYLADENGMVEYNGIMFICDNQKKELQLGDMSNSKDVIRIPLSNGGSLAVNRNNIGDLGQAIGMFSPEDVKLILRALRLDAKVREMEQETEDMEAGIGKDQKERVEGETKEAEEEQREKKRTQTEIKDNADAAKALLTKDMTSTNNQELPEEILNQLFVQVE